MYICLVFFLWRGRLWRAVACGAARSAGIGLDGVVWCGVVWFWSGQECQNFDEIEIYCWQLIQNNFKLKLMIRIPRLVA